MSNRVIFDIGHGSDTWPPSKGVNIPGGGYFAEHDFNSDVALLAKKIAQYNGFEVIFSQEPYSPDTPLNNRSKLANEEHKKSPVLCFISFHANASSNNPNATGHGVFHWYTSDKGKKLAQIWDKIASEDLQNGRWGSGIWVCQPGTWTNFHVVRSTDMPAILLEHFFYTTFKELAECNTPEYKMKCAKVAVKTICEFAGVTYRDPLDDTKNNIIGEVSATVEQAQSWARSKGASEEFIGLAPIFWQIATDAVINPVGVYAQSAKETAFGNFGGVLDRTYCNPCGMKTTQGGGNYDPSAHQKFSNWREGITAQVDHLALYAGVLGYPKANTPDPRHFDFIKGTARYWEDLGGKWAPSATYGEDIVKMMKQIEETIVPVTPIQEEPIEDVSDWAKEAWLKAKNMGLNDGRGSKNPVTEEQLMVFFDRLGLLK